MKEGKGKHITLLHIFTNYKITDKPVSNMTMLQYCAIMQITEQVMKFKMKNKPLMVI